jgi:ribonuclease HI
MHDRMPTDENLMLRGSSMPSMCSSCQFDAENTTHLFFHCPFALKLWSWLASLLNKSLQFNSMGEIWALLDLHWTPQCKVVVTACIFNVVNIIWYRRNQIRFQNKVIHWRSAINMIISKVSLAGNLTSKTAAANIYEFTIMKSCKVNIRPPRAPSIKEIIWAPPLPSWIKINTDGAAIKNPSRAAVGGIFRNSDGACLGGFSQFIGPADALFAELTAAMNAIELAASKGFSNVWLESDSQLVIMAFNSKLVVPWELKNRWENCLQLTYNMRFCASHIYREGNTCADSLANFGLSLSSFDIFWFDVIPEFVRGEYIRNRLGMPNYRFTTF